MYHIIIMHGYFSQTQKRVSLISTPRAEDTEELVNMKCLFKRINSFGSQIKLTENQETRNAFCTPCPVQGIKTLIQNKSM
jgi:hypothetical protein